MSDNDHDVLETGDLDADAGLEDFDTGGKQTFGDAWKTNPMVKIGVVVGGLAILVGGFMVFGGKSNPIAPSVVAGGDKGALKEAPGGKVSDLYAKAVTETNEAAVDQALKTGTSAITTPIGPSKGKVEVEGSKESAEDPLERWRRIQEERTKKEQQAKVEPANAPPPAPPVDPYANQKQQMAQSMAQQMQSILQAQDLKEPKYKDVTPPGWLMQKYKEDLQNAKDLQEAINSATGATAAGANGTAANQAPVEILIEPGKIEYAQLVIEANSDTPGPVLAELASGPLVGDRMIGSFQKMDEFLVLKFDTVVVDGIGLSTEAIALDPETSRPSLVTEVDHKYFKRVILPAAAAFISGIGGAIATSGSTTVAAGQGTVTTAQNDLNSKQEFFKGVEKASDKFGEVLTQDAQNVQVQVRVAAGTHIGVLFTKAVNKNPPGGPIMATTATGTSAPPAAAQPIFLQLAPQTTAQGQTAATATTATPAGATKQ